MSNKLNNETSRVLAEIDAAIKFHENELARLCKLRDDYISNDHAMFADKLKSSMHEKNISQTALAELLGVSQKTISRYCTGVIIPSGEYQNHILSVLNNIKI